MSLRAILGGSRVKKKTGTPSSGIGKSSKNKNSKQQAVSRATWTGLRQTKPGSRAKKASKADEDNQEEEDDDDDDDDDDDNNGDDFFSDDDSELDDSGLASLASDLALRDVIQALRYARQTMFEALPESGYIGNSTRIAELLQMRRRLPPLATTAHVAALLPNATATERETVALVRAGVLRRVEQPQWGRGGRGSSTGMRHSRGSGDASKSLALGSESLSEVLVETAALVQLVRRSSLADDTKAAFVAWLEGEQAGEREREGEEEEEEEENREAPFVFSINGRSVPRRLHNRRMADELVRAGFLLGHGATRGLVGSIVSGSSSGGRGGGSASLDTGDVFARPEDRTTLLSLETVARAASGSFAAVGGVGAVYTAGGGGARSDGRSHGRDTTSTAASVPAEDLVLAIPGHGSFIKLVSAALAHLIGLLARTPFREALETTLRERWDAAGSISRAGKGGNGGSRGKQGYKRVPLSRTKKWKDLSGLGFSWVLAEAVGAGLVEVFETGSVGRGVRLLS